MTGEPGRVAVVTGANRGLGLALVRRLAADGVHAVLTARNEQAAVAAAAPMIEEGLPVSAHELDVTSIGSVARAVLDTAYEHGRIDILVNNAAVAIDRGATAGGLDLERVHATFDSNLFGAWRCVNAVLPVMRDQRYGRVLNLTTHMASLSTMTAGSPAYRISKTALNALTRVLADEVRQDNILVNAASPGTITTRMNYGSATQDPDDAAGSLLWLTSLRDDGPTGGLFAGRDPLPW